MADNDIVITYGKDWPGKEAGKTITYDRNPDGSQGRATSSSSSRSNEAVDLETGEIFDVTEPEKPTRIDYSPVHVTPTFEEIDELIAKTGKSNPTEQDLLDVQRQTVERQNTELGTKISALQTSRPDVAAFEKTWSSYIKDGKFEGPADTYAQYKAAAAVLDAKVADYNKQATLLNAAGEGVRIQSRALVGNTLAFNERLKHSAINPAAPNRDIFIGPAPVDNRTFGQKAKDFFSKSPIQHAADWFSQPTGASQKRAAEASTVAFLMRKEAGYGATLADPDFAKRQRLVETPRWLAGAEMVPVVGPAAPVAYRWNVMSPTERGEAALRATVLAGGQAALFAMPFMAPARGLTTGEALTPKQIFNINSIYDAGKYVRSGNKLVWRPTVVGTSKMEYALAPAQKSPASLLRSTSVTETTPTATFAPPDLGGVRTAATPFRDTVAVPIGGIRIYGEMGQSPSLGAGSRYRTYNVLRGPQLVWEAGRTGNFPTMSPRELPGLPYRYRFTEPVEGGGRVPGGALSGSNMNLPIRPTGSAFLGRASRTQTPGRPLPSGGAATVVPSAATMTYDQVARLGYAETPQPAVAVRPIFGGFPRVGFPLPWSRPMVGSPQVTPNMPSTILRNESMLNISTVLTPRVVPAVATGLTPTTIVQPSTSPATSTEPLMPPASSVPIVERITPPPSVPFILPKFPGFVGSLSSGGSFGVGRLSKGNIGRWNVTGYDVFAPDPVTGKVVGGKVGRKSVVYGSTPPKKQAPRYVRGSIV